MIVKCGEEQRFKITPAQLEAAITDKTRLVVLNSPSNPTGMIYTKAELEALAEVLRKYPEVYIASDDMYEPIRWDDEFYNIATVAPDLYDRTIVLNGVSKAYAMTGWRLGYGIAPKPVTDKIVQLMINSNSCTCSFTQIAGIEALKGSQEFVTQMVAEFNQRRDAVVEGLNKIDGIQCVKPAGAFYVFPNVKQLPLSCDAVQGWYLTILLIPLAST